MWSKHRTDAKLIKTYYGNKDFIQHEILMTSSDVEVFEKAYC